MRRVPNETMDSMTLGIPHDSPYGYLVKNVLWTQYFTADGASLHDNYWSSNFGGVGSHGCLGLSLADSKWLWDWASIGVPGDGQRRIGSIRCSTSSAITARRSLAS